MTISKDAAHIPIFGILFVIVILIAVAVAWWRAGVQQRVWERQGCHMSQWEVFMGAAPVERALLPERAR